MNYVIIGNGTAAVGAIEGIRQQDQRGSITVISDEGDHTYARPLISYYLAGKTDDERIKYRPDSFYEKNGCKTILGKRVTAIEREKKQVRLEDGGAVPYDKLCVCTGSRPFVPPFAGLETVENPHTFLTLPSARALKEAVTKDSRVLIVGAGLIGLKCAEGLQGIAGSICVVDLSPRVLSSILDEQCAGVVQAHLQENGISFILGESVQAFDHNRALFADGREVPFDVLVLAVGVRPNVSLLEDAGAAVGRGILTDSHMRTSLEDIYAAGDCVESLDITTGRSRILALLPNAYCQGETAGAHMAGGDKTFDNAIPMNAIGFFGLHMVTAGSYDGEVVDKSEPGMVKKLFYRDDKLKGFILIGQVEKAGIYTSLIRNQTPLHTLDFALICEKPTLLAFERQYRDQKLGGVV